MNYRTSLLFSMSILFASLRLCSQTNDFGARSLSLAGSTAHAADANSIFSNPAGLSELDAHQIGFGCLIPYQIPTLSSKSIAAGYRTGGFGTAGIGIVSQGIHGWQQTTVKLAYAAKLNPNISAGLTIGYQHIQQQAEYGPARAMTASVGIRGRVNEKLLLSAAAINAGRGKYNLNGREEPEAILRMGAVFNPIQNVSLIAEIGKSTTQGAKLSVAAEYFPVSRICVRGGVAGPNAAYSLGAGYLINKLTIDIGIQTHQTLGLSSQVGLNYTIH